MATEWWRTAAIYQIYPRSFADADGDGMGDLTGVTARLPELEELGIDAIWLSPFYTSPQRDAGYDVADYCDVDPRFGTLADFDAMLEAAHARGIRVIIDLVPNHSSDRHVWFQAALAAGRGSAERARYLFRDGRGLNGELPPNDWQSVFGGPAWTRVLEAGGEPGQWYLHLFDSSQPDFDWANDEVRAEFRRILRFWLDRGVDGFRVDVAHGLVKAEGLPDWTPPAAGGSMGGAAHTTVGEAATGVPLEPGISEEEGDDAPYWAQEGVHEIYREWRRLLDEYPGERILAAEAWVDPLAKVAAWVRPDEMHQAFNFAYLETPWQADALRRVIDDSLEAFAAVGAPSTWVLSNHDVVRHATRLALTEENPQGHGVGPSTPGIGDPAVGLRRARAATALMLALPGSAYLYQGEELGLPEVIDLPDDAREDPTWFRTGGERYGRDGCRVPIPWEAEAPSYGFGPSDDSWLPQPAAWAELARDRQHGVPGSTLTLYQTALRLRRELGVAEGELEWLPGLPPTVVAFSNRDVTVVANLGDTAVPLPAGDLVLASGPVTGELPGDTTVWMRGGTSRR
ncbi:glycoside hydrolase family 13 protein [Agromyces aerolatus]|uniref:glycoside hydrolase family 13 protein n=1 Tax=Agromyces sp. LY-1074 TaxID=3074080 RepID=UPI0028566A45|nr:MULTISPECIES: glycoside hydrolase family 13 protein [unclassified Agromyces]MDR5701383.1 glycoside hydrolase family 13 protein [Agromyces sp. LY-1074]MDR5706828.1 glycoside hydrolase family 13 protein [Agromyces sp. LY-1358]